MNNELTEREFLIMCSRFRAIRTLEQTGILFGVTRERIRQMEAKAIEKIRNRFDETIDTGKGTDNITKVLIALEAIEHFKNRVGDEVGNK